MNRQQYMAARALLRANGRAALRWMQPHHAQVMRRLEAIRRQVDPLEALAFDRRQMAGLQGRLWLEWRRAAWLEAWDTPLPCEPRHLRAAREARITPAVRVVGYLETLPGWRDTPAGA